MSVSLATGVIVEILGMQLESRIIPKTMSRCPRGAGLSASHLRYTSIAYPGSHVLANGLTKVEEQRDVYCDTYGLAERSLYVR